jgi:hypothetical protein
VHGPSMPNRGRLGRVIALGMGVLLLAGCTAGSSFVQPDAAGAGSYYTSEGAYAAPGYYYDESPGDYYYPGESGSGYGTIYGPSLTFGLGFGDPCGWGCGTGYFGGWPWYYGGGVYPYHRRGHHRRGTYHHRGDPDTVGSTPTPRPWLKPDHPRVPPHVAHVAGAPMSVPAQPARRLADRHPLGSASFAPHAFEHARMPRPRMSPRPAAPMEQPALATRPATHAFATPPPRPARVTAPHFAPPSARPAPPMRVAPPPAPPPRTDHAIPARIR